MPINWRGRRFRIVEENNWYFVERRWLGRWWPELEYDGEYDCHFPVAYETVEKAREWIRKKQEKPRKRVVR